MRRLMGTSLLAMGVILGSLSGCGQQAAAEGADVAALADKVVSAAERPMRQQQLEEALTQGLARPWTALSRWREILDHARGDTPSAVEETDAAEGALPTLLDQIVERTSEQVQQIKQN